MKITYSTGLSTIALSTLLLSFSAQADTSAYDHVVRSSYQQNLPGAAIHVSRSGEAVYATAAGMADMELAVAMENDHIFRLASVTKQYTAAAILKLVDEGKLSLDDKVSKWWPDLAFGDVTVHQLLNHTSGIASYTSIPGYMSDTRIQRDLTTAELIAVFAELPLDFAPGSEWRYNNSAYVMLGAIIEKVTAQPWDSYIVNRLLKPLGINDTAYYPDAKITPRRIPGYHNSEDGPINAPHLSMTQPHAAGALSATAADVDKWQVALHSGNVISAASYEKMITPEDVADGYGYGIAAGKLRGWDTLSHGGGIHGFSTYALWLPEQDISVVVLSNIAGGPANPTDIAFRLAAIAAGNPFPIEKTPVEMSSMELEKLVGTYQTNDDTKRTLKLEDGRLLSQRQGGTPSVVIPVGNDQFALEGSAAYFEAVRNESGNVTGVDFYQVNSAQAERAEKVSNEVAMRNVSSLTAEQQERLVGEYELQPGFVITIRRTDAGMTAQATGQNAFPVQSEGENVLFNDQFGIEMVFDLSADGPAQQLTLNQGGRAMPAPRLQPESE